MRTNNSDKIARSPSQTQTPLNTDDEGGDIEWPVHGMVGEDVNVCGISSFKVRKTNSIMATRT